MELARFQQMIFRLFGLIFLVPDEERYRLLLSLADELLPQMPDWPAGEFTAPIRRMLEELASLEESDFTAVLNEYNRLFYVKPAAPPYASVYLDPGGMERPEIILQLEIAYGKAGVTRSARLKDQPDHAAVEFEFAAILCGQEAEAAEQGVEDARKQAAQRRSIFLRKHLGVWVPDFADRIREANPSPLYLAVAEAMEAFVRWALQPVAL